MAGHLPRQINSFLNRHKKKKFDRKCSRANRKGLLRAIERLESRVLLATNIGAVRPNLADSNDLLQHFLDTQPLATGDANAEITFHYGFSATSNNGVGLQGFDDYALAGDLSGIGFDQSVVVRPQGGALQWLGDTDRDTTQEYLFRFGLADMVPLIADMNGDGTDDIIAVDTTTTSNLLEWYVHFGVPGNTPYPTNDSTLSVDATFSFGVDADHPAAISGFADIPRVGDINGDGRADAIVVRNGLLTKDWFISYAANPGNPYPNNVNTTLTISNTISGYGAVAATPVVGDWDNDGDDNIGAVDNTATLTWNLDTNGGGGVEITKSFGLPGDQLIVGRWADVLWDGNQDGDGDGVTWSNANNWSSGSIPTSSQSVAIDQPGLNTITVNATTTVGSVATMERVSFTSGTVVFNNASTFFNGLDLSGGILASNGVLTTSAGSTSNWSAGQVGQGGSSTSITNLGTWTFTGTTSRNLQNAAFTNAGTFSQTATGGSQFGINTSTFTNAVGSTYSLAGVPANPAVSILSGSFTNQGLFTSSITNSISGSFSNAGTLRTTSPLTTFTVPGANNHSGAFEANSGTITFGSGTTNFNTGTTFTAGTVGSFSFNVGGANFNFNENISLSSTVFAAGNISVAVGKTLTLTGSNTWQAAVFAGAGTVRNTGTIGLAGLTSPSVSGTFVNAGTFNHDSNLNISVTGDFINESTGQYLITANTGGLNVSGGSTASLINQGLIRRSSGTGTFNFNASIVGTPTFENDGTIEIQTGSATWQGASDVTHNGTFNLSAGTALTFSNGAQTFGAGAAISGSGQAIFNAGTFNVSSNVIMSSDVRFNGMTLNVLTGNTLTLASTVDLLSGTMGGAGTISVTGTGNVPGASAPTLSVSSFILDGTIHHSGTASLTATGSLTINSSAQYLITASSGGLNATGAAAVIKNLGTIRRTAGAGNFTFNATAAGTPTLENDGVVDLQTGTATWQANQSVTHNGSFNLESGTTLTFQSAAQAFGTGATFTGTGTAIFSSGNITIGDNITIAANATFSGASLLFPTSNTLTLSGTSSITSGAFGSGGTLINTGSTTITAPGGGLTFASSFTNSSNLTIAGGNVLTISGLTNTFRNNSGSLIDFTGDGDIVGVSSATILNLGTLRKSGGTGITAMTGSSGSLGLINQGTVEIQSGTLSLTGNANHTGVFDIASPATLSIGSGNMTFSGTSPFTGSGTLALSSTTFNVLNNATVNHLTSTLSTITTGSSSTLLITGTSSLSGSNVSTNSTLRNTGTLSVGLSGITAPSLSGTLLNAGLVSYSSVTAWSTAAGAQIVNESSGTFQFGGGDISGAGTFTNQGTVQKIAGGASRFFATMVNTATGIVDLQSGTMEISGTGTQLGIFNSSLGTTLTFRNPQTISSAASMAILGTLATSGTGTVTIQGNRSLGGLNVPTNLAVTDNITVTGITSLTGTLSGTGTLTTQGSLDFAGSSTIANGATLINQGTAILDLIDTLAVNGALENEGTISLQRTGSSDNNILGTGTFTNTSTGIIESNASGVISGINIEVDQRGTARANAGTLRFVQNPIQVDGNALTGGTWVADDAAIDFVAAPNLVSLGSEAVVSIIGGGTFLKLNTLRNNSGSFNLTDTLFVGSASAGFVNSGTVTLNNASYSQSVATNYTQSIGSTILLNDASLGSTVTLNGGTFSGNGIIVGPSFTNVAGTVTPGASPGILNITGNYIQGPSGTLNIEIQGTNALVPDFDQLLVSGNASLDGTLNVSLLNSFLPEKLDAFRIMTFASRTGDFAIKNVPSLSGRELIATNPGSSFYDLLGTTIIASNTNDSGAQSLRDAITRANLFNDGDVIIFNIAGPGPHTLHLTSPLPTISAPVTLDATSLPGYTGTPILELDGSGAGPTANGFTVSTTGVSIEGFVINRFSGDGVSLSANTSNNSILNNYIGTDPTGTLDLGNAGNGISILTNSTNNNVSMNLISGNNATGVLVQSDRNKIQGNKIGTDATGTFDLGNGFSGIWIYGGSFNIIGTDLDATSGNNEGNLISGNDAYGVYFQGDSNFNAIAGNLIGINVSGNGAIGNTAGGIAFFNDGLADNNRIGTNGDGIADGMESNTIAGNLNYGIVDYGIGTIIAGNFVGTRIDGTVALANLQGGISLAGSHGMVGGTSLAARNVISGHNGFGISVSGTAAQSYRIIGNYIGTNATGTSAIANSVGVQIVNGAHDNRLGGLTGLLVGNDQGRQITYYSDFASDGPEVFGANSGRIIDMAYGPDGNLYSLTRDGLVYSHNELTNTTTQFFNSGLDANGFLFTRDGYLLISALNGDVIKRYNASTGTFVDNFITASADPSLVRYGKNGNLLVLFEDANEIREYDAATGDDLGVFISVDSPTGMTFTPNGKLAVTSGNSNQVLEFDALTGAFDRVFINTQLDGPLDLAFGPDGLAYVANANSSRITIYDGTTGTYQNDFITAGEIDQPTRLLFTNGRNLISGSDIGLQISGPATQGNHVIGNSFGHNAAGDNRINASAGIAAIQIDTNAHDNFIGGIDAGAIGGARNFIAPYGRGLWISGAHNNSFTGNRIGEDPSGAAGYGGFGIYLDGGSSGNRIGTDADGIGDAGEGNILATGTFPGRDIITITGSGTDDNIVAGNIIGLSSLESSYQPAAGAGYAIRITAGAQGNLIGSVAGATYDVNQQNVFGGHDSAIVIEGVGTSENRVSGNFLGIQSDGLTAVDFGLAAIQIRNGATSNTVGGGTNAQRNVITGFNNSDVGIRIYDAGTIDNRVQGNSIGVNLAGTAKLGNLGYGVDIYNNASNNFIGTDSDGVDDANEGNVIAGIVNYGVVLTTANGNTISGNRIGTNLSGTAKIANDVGVYIGSGASANLVGGSTPAARNILSGNTSYQLLILGSGSSSNTVTGNYVGTNASGSASLLSPGDGIVISGGAANNFIGGTIPGEGNLVSGNGLRGIVVVGSEGTIIQGNLVGTDATGLLPVGNFNNGITILGSTGTIIGGDTPEARNVISATVDRGSWFDDGNGISLSGTSGTIVRGNYIGTDILGNASLANADAGIGLFDSHGDTIGGSAPGEGNVISGNAFDGIQIASSSNGIIQGNLIGTNAAGTALIGHHESNLDFTDASPNFTIGGSSDWTTGTLRGAGNLIAGALFYGVIAKPGTIIQGNVFGLDITGTQDFGNDIAIRGGGVLIGGSTPDLRNIVSGNRHGIMLDDTSGTIVEGNYVGTDRTGNFSVPNYGSGILVFSSTTPSVGNIIRKNLVSGNTGRGIVLATNAVSETSVIGNLIGTNAAGTQALGNSDGISIEGGSFNNTIGGTATEDRNIISGNSENGINADFAGPENKIQGNYIGTDISGNNPLGNTLNGVLVGAFGMTIGGSVAGSGNVISANQQNGILLNGSDTTISGNLIGTNARGDAALWNLGSGIQGASLDGMIGGFSSNERNVIASNQFSISLTGARTRIAGNYVGTDITGTKVLSRLGTGGIGLAIAEDFTIGGGEQGAGNVISAGPGSFGITVQGGGNNVRVQGNFIGTDATGSFPLGNLYGISFETQPSYIIGTDSDGVNDATEGNVISGNETGIGLFSGGIDGNHVIAGNLIGTDATGTKIIGNSLKGMRIEFPDVRIGTNADGFSDEYEPNVIVGSGSAGIEINSADVTVSGNFIGTDRTQTLALPNYIGIRSLHNSNTIGGDAPAKGNIIANSLSAGLVLESDAALVSTVRNNVYYGNLGLAIDAGTLGRSLNDGSVVDLVPDFPVLNNISFAGPNMVLEGFAPSGATLQFFVSANSTTGIGQGKQLIATLIEGSGADLDNGNGTYGPVNLGQTVSALPIAGERFRFAIPIPNGVTHGSPITALNIGSTSEFSPILRAGEVGSSLAPQITLDTNSISLTESTSIEVEGRFYDPDSTTWMATVDYGDGTGLTPLALNTDNSFVLSHEYANPGNYLVVVSITDNSLTTGIKSLSVVVANEPPIAVFNSFTITSPVNEGDLVTLRGEFTDNGGTHTASVVWGDGEISVIPIPAGQNSFTATHIYRDDTNAASTATAVDVYRVEVTIIDDALQTDTTPVGLFLEEVRNVRPSHLLTNFSSTSLIEGQTLTLNGTFVDPGLDDEHTLRIDWGDGVQSLVTLPIGARSFASLPQLSHTYLDDPSTGPDQYTVTVELVDDDEPLQPTVVSQVIQVANVIPFGIALNVTPTAVFENGTVVLHGSFFDQGLYDHHDVTINWGDSSPVSRIRLDPGISSFSGITHQYVDNNLTGIYPITVSISDDDSDTLSGQATTSISVQNQAPQLGAIALSSGGAPIIEGDTLTINGNYSDASPNDRHSVLVHWGDGTTSRAIVDSVTRTFTASHRYLDNGSTLISGPTPVPFGVPQSSRWSAAINVQLFDDDGGTTSATLHQEVNNLGPTVELLPYTVDPAPVPGQVALIASVSDPGLADTHTFTWIAELANAPTTVITGASNVIRLPIVASAVWKITLTASDDEGDQFILQSAMLLGTNFNDSGANRIQITDNTFTSIGVDTLLALSLDGDDVIDATAVFDPDHQVIMYGGAGTDDLYGGMGNDIYILADGNDNANVTLPGRPSPVYAGNDTYRLRPNSTLTVVDLIGDNTLDFSIADYGDQTGVRYDLSLVNSSTIVTQDVSTSQPNAHFVATQGTFSDLIGSRFGDTLTAASNSTVVGGSGGDQLFAKSGTSLAEFEGGADDDVLTLSGIDLSEITFAGDEGIDTLINTSIVDGLEFIGGADNDLLINESLGEVLTLTFSGDEGVDNLVNSGTLIDLTFIGGADDDVLYNHGSTEATTLDFLGDEDLLISGIGSIADLSFFGDEGADTFINLSVIDGLEFHGGADADTFFNIGPSATTVRFGADEDILVGNGSITDLSFFGDDGIDTFINLAIIDGLEFSGGADDDLLINLGLGTEVLEFGGDDEAVLSGSGTLIDLSFAGDLGDDVLVNAGTLHGVTFEGGADDDLLQNEGQIDLSLVFLGADGEDTLINLGDVATLLSFEGDEGVDELHNLGTLDSVLFVGGADDDLLVNENTITEVLTFLGDEGIDALNNLGSITEIVFEGGADDDILMNHSVIESVDFTGDLGIATGGADELINFGSITELTFNGGADDDLLINQSLGELTNVEFLGGADEDTLANLGVLLGTLSFEGDEGNDILINLGAIEDLTFEGGADDDLLQNLEGEIAALNFGGDEGVDTLENLAEIELLVFAGGADDDVLINQAGGEIVSLDFQGDKDLSNLNLAVLDDGVDTLQNYGLIETVVFEGGADDDELLNLGGTLITVDFTGDDGADLLINLATLEDVTFYGGADDDVLINLGEVGTILFEGGADEDLLQNLGSEIESIAFEGGADDDVLINSGTSIEFLEFIGGADDDLLINTGLLLGEIVFEGDLGDDTLVLRGSGTIGSSVLFRGDDGIDAFENNAIDFETINFIGGADNDALLNLASELESLSFSGDEGSDILVNHGDALDSLVFIGGADDDVLVNDGSQLVSLSFLAGADDGVDILINLGNQIESLEFEGGADEDVLANSGDQILLLVFEGGADDDILQNEGTLISTLDFYGDLGNDRFINQKTGTKINLLRFFGDEGTDELVNLGNEIEILVFEGGADDDLLRNVGTVEVLTYLGQADDDTLVNLGLVNDLEFVGGEGEDLLVNRSILVEILSFSGDEGSDQLFNLGAVIELEFVGGADDDTLVNNAAVESIVFFGEADSAATLDDGADTLINNAEVTSIVFLGGADDDILQNNGIVDTLEFIGGADDDLLINNAEVLTVIEFTGDDGVDTLINNASDVLEIVFEGGADSDTLRVQGKNIGNVTFNGGLGTDSFTYNATGKATAVVTYFGDAGNDFFALRGTANSVLFDGGFGSDEVLFAGTANSILSGNQGNDYYRFVGNPQGDVTFTESYSGAGDDSSDTIDLSSFTNGAAHLDLRSITGLQPQGSGLLQLAFTDGMGIENVIGTSFADTIFGNPRNNYIGGADFDDPFTGNIAAPRNVTQWVFIDFDTYTNTGVFNPATGNADFGEYVYSAAERELIRQRVESVYRGPNTNQPWFDVRVVSNLSEIPLANRNAATFATLFINQSPPSGRPGGLASEIDPGNLNLGGSAVVQVNGLLGGIISELDATDEHVEGYEDTTKGDHSEISDTEIGAQKPTGTSENFIRLTAKIAAHELSHLMGLRHQDSFGPIGAGLHDPPGAGAYKPVYTGPSGGVETFDHITGSPASVGSTRFDDLNDLFFGERDAIKLAFANSNLNDTLSYETITAHNVLLEASPLDLAVLSVPNTLSRGVNQPKEFYVQLASVIGAIGLTNQGRSESDWYSFTGNSGDIVNIDVLSNSVVRFGTGAQGTLTSDDYIDSIVRVYNSEGQLVTYYNGLAENDDTFEPTDSSLIDLILPADGTYFIEIDTFNRLGDPLGNPTDPLSPLNPLNPNNILIAPEVAARFEDSANDTDTGNYQLIISKFRKASASDDFDIIKGFGGIDIINPGPTENYNLEYSLGAPPTLGEGDSLQRTITINDPLASAWVASTVDYGTGAGAQPLMLDDSGTFQLDHVYGENGEFTITVQIVNDIGASLIRTLLVNVNNIAPTATISNTQTIVYGDSATVSLTTPFDPSVADTSQGFRYAFALAPSDFSGINYASASSDSQYILNGLGVGSYDVYARIFDRDNGFREYLTSVIVTPRSLNVTADSKTKVYGDTDPGLTYSFGTLYNGDTSSLFSGSLVRSPGENVGSYAIGLGSLTAGNNYSIVFAGANLSITPRSLNVTADAKTKVYGDTDPGLTYSFGTLYNGDTSSLFSGSLVRSLGENVGSYAIGLGSLTAGNNYSIVFAGANLSITPRSLNVTADAKTKVYGDTNPGLTYSFGTLYNGDTSSLFSGSLVRSLGENVGSYAIGLGSLTAGNNYSIVFAGANLSITPRSLNVTADAKTKVYGDADPGLTYSFGTLYNGDTSSLFSGSLVRSPGENVGSYAIGLGSLTAGNNYSIVFAGANLSITPRSLNVTADAKTKVYGDTDPALTYSFGTLYNGDTSSLFSGSLVRSPGENVGSYAIGLGSLTAGNNYSIVFAGANLSITPRSLNVTADAKTKVYGDTDPGLTYSFGTLYNGDTSSLFSGSLVRSLGENVGSYAIGLGSLTAGINYSIVFAGANLSITPRSLNVTADAKTKVYGDTDPALTYSFGTLYNGDTSSLFSGSLVRSPGENVGSYAIGLGSLTAGNNYSIVFAGANLSITPRSLNVTADAKTKVYGDTDPGLTYSFGTLYNGDTSSLFSGSLVRSLGENVGSYAIGLGSLTAGNNYSIVFAGANLSITPRSLNVTADAKTKVYGQPDPAFTYQVSGLRFADTSTAVLTGSLTRQPGESPGVYQILQGTLVSNANYSLVYVGSTLTITGGTTNTAPSVTITTPEDGFMNLSSPFTLHATDADAVDQNGIFTYTVDWGNGTTTVVTGGMTKSIFYTYPAVSSNGSFNISVQVTDPSGATSTVYSTSFIVGGWSLMPDPIHAGQAILVVVGSQDNDNIRIKLKDDDYYKITIVDREDDIRRKGTTYGDIDRILVFGHDGNDRITIDDDIWETVEIWGGAGDDDIKGGSGNDIILGESGNDNLWGGEGRDIVIGGLGADRIHGDEHDDILIAGFVMYEKSFAQSAPSGFGAAVSLTLEQHRVALESILAEWTSGRSYTTRRQNIMGIGSGTRNNGTYYLKTNLSTMTANTVFDDAAVDRLWGDTGTDWFFANNLGDQGNVLDDIRDRSGSEVIEDLDKWW